MDELISIIVPVYNVDNYLHRSINSIINQTYKNLEIILIDDGSTDSSSTICDEYQLKDERITVIHQKNGGVSSARNKVLELAKGQYIGFVDPDDWIEYEMYQILYDIAIEYDANIVECNYKSVKQSDSIAKGKIYNIDDIINVEKYNGTENILELLLKLEIPACIWNKLYRHDKIKNISFDNLRHNEDLIYLLEVIERVTTFIKIDKCLYNYNSDREDSLTNSSFDRLMLEAINHSDTYINKYYKSYPKLSFALDYYKFCTNIGCYYHRIKECTDLKLKKYILNRNKNFAIQFFDSCFSKKDSIVFQSVNIDRSQQFIIYGLGIWSFILFDYLISKSKEVVCFITSEKTKKSATFKGIPIYSLSEFEHDTKDCLIFVGVLKKSSQKEIIYNLENKNIKNKVTINFADIVYIISQML